MARALFPYYGSKLKLTPWIVSTFPEHDAYIEPFAGSAAVLLGKERSRFEVLNDLNGDVVCFWRVLRERTGDLIASLERTPYARDEYLLCRDEETTDDLEKARRFFVRTCMAFNASTAKVGFSFTAPTKAPKAPTFVRRIDQSLQTVAERIHDVEIENIDALVLLQRWDRPGSLVYLDPPYLDDTRSSKNDYATDNGDVDFHNQLINTISGFKGRVVLSGYKSGLYDSLTDIGWFRVDKDVQAPTSNTKGRSGRRVESLWMNFEPAEKAA